MSDDNALNDDGTDLSDRIARMSELREGDELLVQGISEGQS
jgi:hypothetical protein